MSGLLVGRVLNGIKISPDNCAISLLTDVGVLYADAVGDCCSSSWIEHIEVPALGMPALIVAVEDLDMLDLGDQDGHECMQYYGYKITTDSGDLVIDYRNSSNGYYGGWLQWQDEFNSPLSCDTEWRDVIYDF